MADAPTINVQEAMKETKASAFARAISVEPKKLRAYCRNTLKFRTSEDGPLTPELQAALIEHFVPEEARTAPAKGKKSKAKA